MLRSSLGVRSIALLRFSPLEEPSGNKLFFSVGRRRPHPSRCQSASPSVIRLLHNTHQHATAKDFPCLSITPKVTREQFRTCPWGRRRRDFGIFRKFAISVRMQITGSSGQN
jgi:hypothetical protein